MTVGGRGDMARSTGLVIEHSPLVRAGLESVLRRCGLATVLSMSTATSALTALRESAPSPTVAVVGSVPDQTIGGVTRLLTERHGCAVVAVVPVYDLRNTLSFLRTGALSVLGCDASTSDVEQAVVAAIEGRRHLTSDVMDGIVTGRSFRVRPGRLTPRERQVLDLVATGRTNLAIARALSISEETVKSHVSHVFQKLGVHRRSEAVAAAIRLGLV